MSEPQFTCAALNQSGFRCHSLAVAETGWWRCLKHLDWYGTATKEERETLARIEIAEAIEALGPYEPENLDTRR